MAVIQEAYIHGVSTRAVDDLVRAMGLTGTPTAYYADTPLVLTAVGGTFATGDIRLAIHYTQLVPPRTV